MHKHSVLIANTQPLLLKFSVSRYPIQTLGQRIRKARLERELFQVDLARKLGVNEMSVVNWEKDRTIPVRAYREKIRGCLGLDIE